MNIAVTGASGFISKNLIVRLNFEKNCKIFKITRQTSKKNLNSALLAADIIFHFAGANKPKKKDFSKKTTQILQSTFVIFRIRKKKQK